MRGHADEERTRQITLLRAPDPDSDPAYADDRSAAMKALRELLPRRLQRDGPQRFGDLWPRILCAYHLTLADLRGLVDELRRAGIIEIRDLKARETSAKDDHILVALATEPPSSS